MPTHQVAVRITDEQLEALDWLVARCDYDSRGEAIRSALASFTKQERDREIDEKIRRSYAERPETDEERFTTPASVLQTMEDDSDDWSGW